MFSEEAQSTVMTILKNAASPDEHRRRAAIERFCQTYAQPLKDYLKNSKRITEDDAEEVTQSFFSQKLFSENGGTPFIVAFLKKKAETPDLSFRRYLASSVSNHFISLTRKKGREVPVGDLQYILDLQTAENAEEDIFDVAWANHLMIRVLDSVRLDCVHNRQIDLWKIFEAHVLAPAIAGRPSPGYAELAMRFDLRDPKQAANRLQTVSRKFQRYVAQAVKDYLPRTQGDPGLADTMHELQEMMAILSKPGGLRLTANRDSEDNFSNGYGLSEKTSRTGALHLDLFAELNLFGSTADLKVAWQHLLRLPFDKWLFATTDAAPDFCLRDMLDEAFGDVELCDKVRSRSKQLGTRENKVTESGLPSSFLAATYLLAIVVAKDRTKTQISTQSDEQLKIKIEKITASPWLDHESKSLFLWFLR